ncbi:MAG TPA: MFS transporter, partial [Verrucomicrobiae bacterium]|nr:MFS transporter [Verrucomicrobiae bacterium]
IGLITGSFFLGRITVKVFRSHKRTLYLGQGLFALLLLGLTGPAEHLPRWGLWGLFFAIGLSASSGVAIYAMIREMFPVRIVATALTSLNFFVLLGAASVQQLMGFYIESFTRGPAGYPPAAYHGAFLGALLGLLAAAALFTAARDPGLQGEHR